MPSTESITQNRFDFLRAEGHHRISVGRVFGEEFIDAEVIDLDCVTIPDDNSSTCILEECS